MFLYVNYLPFLVSYSIVSLIFRRFLSISHCLPLFTLVSRSFHPVSHSFHPVSHSFHPVSWSFPSFPGRFSSFPGRFSSFPGRFPPFPGCFPSFPGRFPSFPGCFPSFPGRFPSFPGRFPRFPVVSRFSNYEIYPFIENLMINFKNSCCESAYLNRKIDPFVSKCLFRVKWTLVD